MKKDAASEYEGFEQGAIRPPSEADSLLLRLTRNCPWNHCTFCRVYKKHKFSFRPVDHILKDIDLMYAYISRIRQIVNPDGITDPDVINTLFSSFEEKDRIAFNAAMNWYAGGMKSIFLQDANSLIMKPDELITVLEYIKKYFPDVRRITSYARSHTVARISREDLSRIANAGLNRIHIGMESGSDAVLKRIKKGATKAIHIKAGLKVKQAGMELSEYVMPGLGGIPHSIEHALETASALNSINPDFIRIRTLAVTPGTRLADEVQAAEFEKPTDEMMAKELRLFIESLDGITSRVKSDHILNLFENLEGTLPGDKGKMIAIIDDFFSLSPEKRILYQIGRRMGFFRGPEDMEKSPHLERVRQACDAYGVTSQNVDVIISELMKRFV